MKNPFKIGDKVRTKVAGNEVDSVVTKLWQNEVQVRTPDNELRWRSMYTVWYPGGAPLPRPQKTIKTVGGAAGGANSSAKSASASRPRQAKKAALKQPKKRR